MHHIQQMPLLSSCSSKLKKVLILTQASDLKRSYLNITLRSGVNWMDVSSHMAIYHRNKMCLDLIFYFQVCAQQKNPIEGSYLPLRKKTLAGTHRCPL